MFKSLKNNPLPELFGRLLFRIPTAPKVAQIEVTNACNLSCRMCQRLDLGVKLEHMDLTKYKKVIRRLGKSINMVTLTGWGEPLFHPEIIEMVKIAKKAGKKVQLTTNGLLLTEYKRKPLLDAGIDSISFSLDDLKAPMMEKDTLGHPVRNQLVNIEAFMNEIKTSGKHPKVVIQTTLHLGREKKVFEVMKYAAKIGADLVNVNRLDLRFATFLKRPNYIQEKQFVKKLVQNADKYKIRADFLPHTAFSGIKRLIYQKLIPFMNQRGKHCLRVYNYIYVNRNGQVTPCCSLPLWAVGDLMNQRLKKIWTSPKFQLFREHEFQRKVCGKCDVLEIFQWT